MAREEVQLSAAKRAYRNAKAEGNRQEEAKWANVIGDILKNRGEYVEALRWLRIDYEISIKYLPEKQLLPTCQSLGEVYLRLECFKDALVYQKKHLELAKDANDLIEQQRASTQLGRTYHEMFLRSEDDHYSVRNAKKYFKSAMKLAQTLKENPPTNKSSFLKEYIDAHNNMGMLEMDVDNLEAAQEILTKGLEICDEEEVIEDDDGRSRLHHNLGSVYMELRKWDKAREHIEKDIIICKRIGHRQGEAKGYINLGELHYRVHKYEEAILCYQKALDLAKSMEDEDALVGQIEQNIDTVKEAIKVMDELKKEEQILKKLSRQMVTAKGTPNERKCLLQQNASLDRLIEKSSTIFAWRKHREFSKSKKRIASELCDKEKLSDAFLVIGESYQKLRNFNKAIKWYTKGWEGYKLIGNLEGQALAKINIGDVLDCDGNWTGALDAFEEGYRIAVEANLPSVQISALENMHYSHMIRFDNVEEARRLQLQIDKLKESKSRDLEAKSVTVDCCSETDTDENDHLSDSRTHVCSSRENDDVHQIPVEELHDDVPLISLLRASKNSTKMKLLNEVPNRNITGPIEASPKTLSESTTNQQTPVGRKRIRIVLSDDEAEMGKESEFSKGRIENVATSNEIKIQNGPASPSNFQDVSAVATKFASSSCNPLNNEESACSYKSMSPKVVASNGNNYKYLSAAEAVASDFAASGSKCNVDTSEDIQHKHSAAHVKLHSDNYKDLSITFKIDHDLIHMEAGLCSVGNKLSIECLKVELACLYYLQLPLEKRSKGLLPIIQSMKCGGRVLESLEILENLKDHTGKVFIEVLIDGWVQKGLMKLYIDCCKELSEIPNMKVLKKLYISEVEDEVNVAECELQDISITPLLNALHIHKMVAMLDFSHNLLGNGTLEKLKQFFTLSNQRYGDLTLDLHCNRFGPTALFQICECPVLFTRLEVLNISGNRLTDACGSYLSTILENCKALYSLNIERCSITSRTIQKIADALGAESALSQLFIGHNNPISGNAIMNLLAKLATLKSFSELSMNGLKLSKPAVDSLSQLAKTSSLSRLMLGGTGIGTDGALQLTESLFCGAQEPVKLDLSYCALTSTYTQRLNCDVTLICNILQLNLGGNPIKHEGSNVLASLLMNPQCCLKVLVLNDCELGLAGILQIIQALADNNYLEELILAGNAEVDKYFTLQYDLKPKASSEVLQQNLDASKPSTKVCVCEEVDNQPDLCVGDNQKALCGMNTDYNMLEVADSEDDPMRIEAGTSVFDDSCTSSCQRNSSQESQFIRELSTAISMVKQLQLLDLSNNGFSAQASETLYTAWSSGIRANSAWRHIEEKMVHLSVEANKCCKVKPCCRRD